MAAVHASCTKRRRRWTTTARKRATACAASPRRPCGRRTWPCGRTGSRMRARASHSRATCRSPGHRPTHWRLACVRAKPNTPVSTGCSRRRRVRTRTSACGAVTTLPCRCTSACWRCSRRASRRWRAGRTPCPTCCRRQASGSGAANWRRLRPGSRRRARSTPGMSTCRRRRLRWPPPWMRGDVPARATWRAAGCCPRARPMKRSWRRCPATARPGRGSNRSASRMHGRRSARPAISISGRRSASLDSRARWRRSRRACRRRSRPSRGRTRRSSGRTPGRRSARASATGAWRRCWHGWRRPRRRATG